MTNQTTQEREMTSSSGRRPGTIQAVVCLLLVIGLFALFTAYMGLANMFSTLMKTAFDLVVNTCLYIMSIAVMMGAISAIFTEFGVIDLFNRVMSPVVKPLYGLPGASALGIITTYLSDNPAILSLADDRGFKTYFKKYQLPALINLGTAFGMGLIITTYMIGQENVAGVRLLPAIIIGNAAAIIGGVVSVRLMLYFTKKRFGTEEPAIKDTHVRPAEPIYFTEQGVGTRVMNAMLDGGKNGVQLGLAIIPGVVIICTLVLMLTYQTAEFTGAAYEGIGLLPRAAEALSFIIRPLFGFVDSSAIAVPITAMGSAGAAMAIVPKLLSTGAATAHDVSVFMAVCMCWSGYLSTHVSMMDSLGYKDLTGKAVVSHTIGGLVAGVTANWLYVLLAALF